jgi:uncharacterized protein (TIGR01244 family)
MKTLKITDTIAVSGQISPAQVAELAEAGFKVLVNNRPDGEEAGQPGSAEIEAAAISVGLEYHHLPVTAMDFPGPDAARMATLFDDESRPVFAFCRTGTRSANLWVVTRPAEEQQKALARAQALGFDLGMAARTLG